MPSTIPYNTFIEIFPEFRREFTEPRYNFFANFAVKMFSDCFCGFVDTDCEFEILGLFTAHLLWVKCNMGTGGTIEQVKGVNSSVTYNTLEPSRFLSNLGLSPYGIMITECAQLSYFTAGALLNGVCC